MHLWLNHLVSNINKTMQYENFLSCFFFPKLMINKQQFESLHVEML